MIIIINHKHLPNLMDKRYYGCKNNRLNRRDHDCLMITTEEWLDMYFVDLFREIDVRLINLYLKGGLWNTFVKSKFWTQILDNKQWCEWIKNRIVTYQQLTIARKRFSKL